VNESNTIYTSIKNRKGSIAVLIDPEKSQDFDQLEALLKKAMFVGIDFLFIGGSTVTRKEFECTIKIVRSICSIPIVIFPGAAHQISEEADAILYLSLLSGRNPDYLIGHHIQSAQELFDMDIEVIPTAYLLIDGGTKSSVAYVSQTTPIPRDQVTIVKHTAMAAKMQGKGLIYLDAGSGAKNVVPENLVRELEILGLPIIIGGGIRDVETIRSLHKAGTNVVVIGNRLEEDADFLLDIHAYLNEMV
jgi:putative glycerol-1-phosphate prenyltransferase